MTTPSEKCAAAMQAAGLCLTQEPKLLAEYIAEMTGCDALRASHDRLLGVCVTLSRLPLKSVRRWFEKDHLELTDAIAQAAETPWHVHETASNEVWAKRGPIAMMVARPDDDSSEEEANARLIAAAPAVATSHDRLLGAVRLVAAGPVDEPEIDLTGDWEKGLFCGLEDVGLQGDGYKACVHGFEKGVERALEWAQGVVCDAMTQAEKVTG